MPIALDAFVWDEHFTLNFKQQRKFLWCFTNYQLRHYKRVAQLETQTNPIQIYRLYDLSLKLSDSFVVSK